MALLTLYKNFKKRGDSTRRPSANEWQVTADITLKAPTSLDNPVFLIEGNDGDMPDMNYCKYLDRYYFIRERVARNDGLFELHCDKDVLATFRNDIAQLNTYVERSASNYNPFLNDELLSSEQRIVYANEASTSIGFSRTDLYYLVRVIGKGEPSGTSGGGGGGREATGAAATGDYTGTDLFVLTKSQFNRLMDFAFTSSNFSVEEITDELKKLIFNPFQYIVDVMVLPHDLSGTTFPDQREIYLGYYGTGITAPIAPKKLNMYVPLNMPAPYYPDDFRRFNPRYSQYNMYIPAVGTVLLNPADINTQLSMNVTLDFQTGNIFYVLGRGANVIASYSGQAAVPVQISQLASRAGGIMSFGASALTGVAGIASGNVAAGLGGLTGAINVTQAITSPTPSINGTAGNLANLLQFPDIFISMSAYASADFPIAQFGRPCHKYLTLGTLTGFVKCAGASINIAGTSADKEAVNAYLNGGFYME